MEPVPGLLARTGPIGPQMSPVEPVSGLPVRTGPIGPQMALRKLVESVSGLLARTRPTGPRWSPGGSVESLLGFLARTRPRGPQMIHQRPCGVTFGPSCMDPAPWAPDEFQEALWRQFLVPGTGRFHGANMTPNFGSALHSCKDVVESKLI